MKTKFNIINKFILSFCNRNIPYNRDNKFSIYDNNVCYTNNDSNEKKKISKIEKGGENCERKDKRII